MYKSDKMLAEFHSTHLQARKLFFGETIFSFKTYLKLAFTIVDNNIQIHTNYLQEKYTLYFTYKSFGS